MTFQHFSHGDFFGGEKAPFKGRFLFDGFYRTSILELILVTKNEPDYRLFLVHILHTLEKLDDRPVRDNEKQTAKIHFDQNKKWSHYRDVQGLGCP